MDLTPEAFNSLLARLDSDRDEAGRKYVDLLRKLTRFLGYWGCTAPQEQADDALSRTAARIFAGEQIENLLRYTLGIAQLVYKESVRHEANRRSVMKPSGAYTDRAAAERRARCYARCLRALPRQDQDLITRYYSGAHAPDRAHLAKQRGISLSSLRVAAFRIRQKLALCLEECLNQAPEM